MILAMGAVSSLLDGDNRLTSVLGKSKRHQLPLVVVAEYLFGLKSSTKASRLQSVFRRLVADSEVLCPDRGTADWYAQIRYDLKQRGRPIPEGDLWIAALARQHSLEIVSRDQHFDLIAGLTRIGC